MGSCVLFYMNHLYYVRWKPFFVRYGTPNLDFRYKRNYFQATKERCPAGGIRILEIKMFVNNGFFLILHETCLSFFSLPVLLPSDLISARKEATETRTATRKVVKIPV